MGSGKFPPGESAYTLFIRHMLIRNWSHRIAIIEETFKKPNEAQLAIMGKNYSIVSH